MTNFTFELLKKEELIDHPVSGSIGYNIEYFISNDMHGDLAKGVVRVIVNENGIFPDLVQLNKNVNTEIRSSLIIKLKEYVKDLE
ncbi:hypothetical protein ACFFIX_12265 [Metabacillus herbersteinensis]|uniref:Uncharacterized protein n=1 Tax=Metabacillus herbersteinensis TaxID=283816 RepID=A0ABV6GEU4_9BACI